MRALENKNAIITGGARGFGRAITERFIADGAKVLICSRTIEELKKTIEINLMGTVYCTRLALEQMKNQKHGKIINLAGAGVGGKKPLSRFSAYYTSKAAVAAFTEVVASEVANYNIQVNCISPGAINTYFTDYLIAQGPEKAGPMYEQALKQKETGGDSPALGAIFASFH